MQQGLEMRPRQTVGVRATKERTSRIEHSERQFDQGARVVLKPEDVGTAIPGKGWGIQHHDIKTPVPAIKAPEPIERIAVNEIVRRRVDPVGGIIPFTPVEVTPGKVEVDRKRAPQGCGHP